MFFRVPQLNRFQLLSWTVRIFSHRRLWPLQVNGPFLERECRERGLGAHLHRFWLVQLRLLNTTSCQIWSFVQPEPRGISAGEGCRQRACESDLLCLQKGWWRLVITRAFSICWVRSLQSKRCAHTDAYWMSFFPRWYKKFHRFVYQSCVPKRLFPHMIWQLASLFNSYDPYWPICYVYIYI